MDHPRSTPPTIVCVGGNTATVRGVCARVKRSGYCAIAVVTNVNPGCTLPLLTALCPEAILVSDDLPGDVAQAFTESLQGLYPETGVLLLEKNRNVTKAVLASLCATRNREELVPQFAN